MSHLAALCALIDTNVSAIAGQSPAPLPADAVFPYLTVNEITSKEMESLSGSSGVTRTVFQFNVYDKVYENAESARKAIKDYLMPFKGTAGSYTILGVNMQQAFSYYNGDLEIHQAILRLSIWWG